MSIKCYRTILEKSNPAIIREFQIDDNRSFQELVLTIALLHGWDTDADNISHARTDTGVQFSAHKRICDLFPRKKALPVVRIQYPILRNRSASSNEYWTFRLEEACNVQSNLPGDGGEKPSEPETREPKLLKAIGINPLAATLSLRDWNQAHYQLLFHGQMADYFYGTTSLDELTPDLDRIAGNLYYQIQLGRKPFKLNPERSESLFSILSAHTLSELKQIQASLRLSISTAGRKADVVQRMAGAINRPEIWHKILEEMDIRDYLNFMDCCSGKYTGTFLYIAMLEGYGLIHHKESSWLKDTLPKELLEYYASLVYSGEDTILLRRKNLQQVFQVCCHLYGVFSRKQFRIIADIMFPDTYREEDITDCWKSDDEFEVISSSLIYYRPCMSKNDAALLYKELEEQDIPYYTPDQAEALQIAREGLAFPKGTEEGIVRQISRMIPYDSYYRNMPEYFSNAIYSLYHLGWNRSQIEQELRQNYSLGGSQKDYRKLFDLAEQSRMQIRMLQFRGQTQEYIEQLMAKRAKDAQKKAESESKSAPVTRSIPKVYPNSPCPCGSGKKYKYCHGRTRS